MHEIILKVVAGDKSDRERQAQAMRAANLGVIERLLGQPAQPETEGGYVLRVVETTGRRSSRPRRTPLGVLRYGGRRYLVSPDAARNWVRNLEVNPRVALLAGSSREELLAACPDPEEAAEVVLAYLNAARAPWVWAAFPLLPTPSRDDVLTALSEIAVFRLEPLGQAER